MYHAHYDQVPYESPQAEKVELPFPTNNMKKNSNTFTYEHNIQLKLILIEIQVFEYSEKQRMVPDEIESTGRH